jgi:ABC-2 type transport system ATP-binding protein
VEAGVQHGGEVRDALVIERVTKRFPAPQGAVTALDGFRLRMAAGDVVALVGPNGAGKSTALRVAAGVVRPDAGSVSIAGRLGAMLDGAAALYPRLTVRENVEYFAALNGVPHRQARDRATHALRRFGLEGLAGTLFQKLSRGLRQRVALICRVIHEPAVLVLDEPTTGVDADCRAGIVDLVAALRRDGAAILLATHDPELVDALASRVGVMRAGGIASWREAWHA